MHTLKILLLHGNRILIVARTSTKTSQRVAEVRQNGVASAAMMMGMASGKRRAKSPWASASAIWHRNIIWKSTQPQCQGQREGRGYGPCS